MGFPATAEQARRWPADHTSMDTVGVEARRSGPQNQSEGRNGTADPVGASERQTHQQNGGPRWDEGDDVHTWIAREAVRRGGRASPPPQQRRLHLAKLSPPKLSAHMFCGPVSTSSALSEGGSRNTAVSLHGATDGKKRTDSPGLRCSGGTIYASSPVRSKPIA